MSTTDLTEATFESTITDNEIVLVDWWASWCGPCRMFAPIYEEVAGEQSGVVFGKIDTEANQALAGAFQIQSIPTLMAFRDQVLVYSQPGALPKEALEDLVEQVRNLDMDDVRAQIDAQSDSGSSASS